MALPDVLPDLTLGWGVLDWCTANLAHPNGDLAGTPWIFTNEQSLFVLWFYSVNDSGEFIYRRAVIERPKGAGKSPFLASLCAAELLGPVKFDRFVTRNGTLTALGRQNPEALVQIAAISEAQVENSYAPLMEMLLRRGADKKYGLDVGLTRILYDRGRKIEKVTASPRSREGRQTTFAVMDETWLWVPAEHGPELSQVIAGNLAKKNGRFIETTNAHRPGEGSVAEMSHDYALQIESGEVTEAGMLYDSRRGHCEDIYDHDQFITAAKYVYGDATWAPLERFWREVNDPMNPEAEMRRKYLNELHRGDTAWLKEEIWRSMALQRPKPLKKSDKIALGFKGATRSGSAALVACRLTDGALFLLDLWERPVPAPKGWEVSYKDVNKAVRRRLKALHANCILVADPWQYQDIVGRWAVDFEDAVEEFWLSQKLKLAKAVDNFTEAVHAGRIQHDGDLRLQRHILSCQREELAGDENNRPFVIKPASPKETIGAAQAAVLAYEAAQLSIAAGALKEEEEGDIWGY